MVSFRSWRTTALVAAWFAASAGVWAWTVAYGTTTAQPTHLALADPAPIVDGIGITRPTLYLFMHPRCPCTRATVTQLQRVLASSGLDRSELPEVSVVATIPVGVAEDDDTWRQSETLRQAADLPNATVHYDEGGVRAQSFGAQASGSVALYAADGRLLFAGGVTVSRGHDGESLGAEQLRKQIQNPKEGAPVTAPALGCRLCRED
ncbi:hypothetical protein [Botrimarina mediterranea]|uniref:hypothetical protein n=1 Tax=Botrimarina mediterranea TaxID=2528022 RepID=UPI0011A34770|nr:hypothetical protein [Botrimarina mediterranea]